MRWFIFILIFGVIDIYAFQAFRTVAKNNWLYIGYWLVTLIVIGNFIYHFYGLSRGDFGSSHGYAFAFVIALLVPKMILLLILFGEDIFRIPQAMYRYFTEGEAAKGNYLPSRRKFISQMALGIAAIPFASILYGIYKGKYNFKVLKYTLRFEDLPEAFDGYKLTQISDIHAGSFDNIRKVEYAIDLINEQQSDVILFTGDMVNNEAKELEPYLDRVFDSVRRVAGLKAEKLKKSPLDVLIDSFDPDRTSVEVKMVFDSLKAELPGLINKIMEKQKSEKVIPLSKKVDEDTQKAIGLKLMERMEFSDC